MAWTMRELANLDLSTIHFGDDKRPSRAELEDQYYAALGELIEQRPIGRPPGAPNRHRRSARSAR